MRRVKWLTAAVSVALIFAGCSDPAREAGKRLAKSVDEARRRYNSATTLLADPQYILDIESGDLTRVDASLLAATTRSAQPKPPADNALQHLKTASQLVGKALADNPQAPTATKANANLLLGQIQLAIGRYHAAGAGRMRSAASRARRKGRDLLVSVRDRAALAKLYADLGSLPADQTANRRDKAQRELQALAAKIKSAEDEIAKLEAKIDALAKTNEGLLERSEELRDRGATAGGPQGLDLMTKAADIDVTITQNQSTMSAYRKTVAFSKADLALLKKRQFFSQLAKDSLDKRLKDMARQDQRTAGAMTKARAEAEAYQEEVEALVAEAGKHGRIAEVQEKLALDALGDAVRNFDAAEKQASKVRSEADAAKRKKKEPDEILAALADDQHVASLIGLRASASLGMGELRRSRIAAVGADEAFAKEVEAAAKLLGKALPEATSSVLVQWQKAGSLIAPDRKAAEANYQAAENDLEGLLRKYLTGKGIGRNIRWMYQGKLAKAYFGHHLLAGDRALLGKARDWVEKATAQKEDSPHVAALVDLKGMIDLAWASP